MTQPQYAQPPKKKVWPFVVGGLIVMAIIGAANGNGSGSSGSSGTTTYTGPASSSDLNASGIYHDPGTLAGSVTQAYQNSGDLIDGPAFCVPNVDDATSSDWSCSFSQSDGNTATHRITVSLDGSSWTSDDGKSG